MIRARRPRRPTRVFVMRPRRNRGGEGTPAKFQSVNSDGWSVTYASPPTFAPDTSPELFTVSRQGFDTSGNATTYSENLICTQRIRQPYPNQASLTADQVALSDYIYSTDTISGVTNNSTEISPTAIARWALPDRVVVGNTVSLEVVAFHRNTVAAVEFRATDGTNTVTAVVSEMTVSSTPGDKNAVLVYAATLNIASLSDNADITVNAKVFPRIGGSGSVLDSANQSNLFDFSPRVYRKNTSRASSPPIVYVASTGDDLNGSVSTDDSVAAANPCLTLTGAINRARTVLGTGTGSLDGLRVRLTAGTWSRSANPTGNTVNAAIVIEPGTGVAKADAVHEFGSLNNTFAATYVRYSGITIRRQGAFYPFNTTAGHCVFENCDIDFNGQTGALAGSAANFFFVNVAMTGHGGSVTAAGSQIIALLRGCSFGVANSGTQVEPNCVIGCEINGSRTLSGTRSLDRGVIAFNRWLRAGSSSGPVLSIGTSSFAAVTGFAIVQNVIEYTSATSNPAIAISHDSASADTSHIVVLHNTIAGFNDHGRSNLLYDETVGDPRTHKLMRFVGNLQTQINNKGDVFILDGARTGNFPYLYGVGCFAEFLQFRDAGSGSFAQEFPGIAASIGTSNTVRNDPLFTDYEGTTSGPVAGAGGGTYTLSVSSPCKGRVTTPVLKFDLAGNARSLTAATSGAYE